MAKFLRSVDSDLKKQIQVVHDDGTVDNYSSILNMPKNNRMAYILEGIACYDEEMYDADQVAFARESVKQMMIQQAYLESQETL
jgi:hypothetical protein